MKKKFYLSLILLFAFSFQSMAQGFTNYKAVVSDNAGNILTNQNLDIRFTIYDGDPGTTGVQIFQETHNTTTDDNGIVVVNIGEVEVPDWFNINWSGTVFYLQTEYNIGSGFVDMGTQAFRTVPYAQYAHKAQYSIYSQHASEVDFSDISNVPAGLSDGDDDTHLTDTQIAAMGYIKNANDADHDATNELQNLTLNSTQLSISNGNNVSFSGWDTDASDDVQSIDDLTDAKYIGLSLFIGEYSGTNDDGTNNQNVGVGRASLKDNTVGFFNTAIGVATLTKNISGHANTAVGAVALNSNTTGNNNTALGYYAGKFNQTGSGNVFLGHMAGFGERGSNKLYIENSNSATPLIGGDFSTNEVTINGNIEVTKVSGNTLATVSTQSGDADLYIKSTGTNLPSLAFYTDNLFRTSIGYNINHDALFIYHGQNVFFKNGNILPTGHKSHDLGASGNAWDDVYADNFVNEGAAAFTDRSVTAELILHKPIAKKDGDFDAKTPKGLYELNPDSLPDALRAERGLLIDEMATYNYKANYEQQVQINELKALVEQQQKLIEKLSKKLEELERKK